MKSSVPTTLACALALVITADAKSRNPVVTALFAVALLVAYVIAASFVGPFCGSTTVTSAGLTLRTLLRTRVVTWPQVQAFRVSSDVDRGIDHCLVEVRLHRGRAVVLPGMVASSADDPELRSRLVELRAAWAAARPDAAIG
ncbi:PH domain-containing protein [Kitasatospora viridis]|uniref:PH domain-containing protein n=1 Tax=Kitasatospora viridis TaxID=281105 RepID=UPI00147938FE|nr:PH domain-containing protein [Kitasatospora viridis]